MPIHYAPWLEKATMASYFHDISTTGKVCYKAKLEVVGLIVKDDPYMLCNASRFRLKCLCGLKLSMATSLLTLSPDLARTLKSSYSLGNS